MDSRLPRPHHDYTLLDGDDPCRCSVCTDYQNAVRPYLKAMADTEDHDFRCPCVNCREKRQLNRAQLAADNRRTLWCEACFTAIEKSWGDRFLDWVETILIDGPPEEWVGNKSPTYWWGQKAEGLSLAWWLETWLDESGYTETGVPAERIMKNETAVLSSLRRKNTQMACELVTADAAELKQ